MKVKEEVDEPIVVVTNEQNNDSMPGLFTQGCLKKEPSDSDHPSKCSFEECTCTYCLSRESTLGVKVKFEEESDASLDAQQLKVIIDEFLDLPADNIDSFFSDDDELHGEFDVKESPPAVALKVQLECVSTISTDQLNNANRRQEAPESSNLNAPLKQNQSLMSLSVNSFSKKDQPVAYSPSSFTQAWPLIAPKQTKIEKPPYTCSFSKLDFFDQEHTNCRRQVHANAQPFICSTCEKVFNTEFSLKEHQLCHRGFVRPYLCPLCLKALVDRASPKAYVRLRTGKEPYQCSICWKWFTQASNCRQHNQNLHLELSQSPCLTTPKPKHTAYENNFTQSCDLKRDPRMAPQPTDSKTDFNVNQVHKSPLSVRERFSCSVCGKDSSKTWYLKILSQIHVGEKIFQCLICSKAFTQKGSLQKHRLTHSGKRPFTCSICCKGFLQQYVHIQQQMTQKAMSVSNCIQL